MSGRFIADNDFVDCARCQHEGYIPVYIKRADGYYEKVYSKCSQCGGAGYYKPAYLEHVETRKEHAHESNTSQ